MQTPHNQFKQALKDGRQQFGLWFSSASPLVAEMIAWSGWDWILVDCEHAPNEVRDVLAHLQAMNGAPTTPVVRPDWNDPVRIKRLLDIGATSFLIPMVQNAEEAKRAVAAVRYPPRGIRGVATGPRANRFGRMTDYWQRADEEMCLLVQVETQAAVRAIPEIAKVDGVDGIFVGPSDLGADMGYLGQQAHPKVQEAVLDMLKRCQDAGIPAGTLMPQEPVARKYLEAGFAFVALGSDLGVLRAQSEALLQRFRSKPG